MCLLALSVYLMAVAEYNQNTRINKIDAVPMVIVNKKYRVKTEGINSAEEYFQLINFLAEKRS
jgi:predicted DsbA family dithiol-disulfide isomerase